MDLVLPPPRRQRSRRLRKKLRIGEFQQLGFAYEIHWAGDATSDAKEQFLEHLLAEVVEPRGLCLGGGPDGGFVSARRGGPTDDDRAAFEAWVGNWPGISGQRVGPLQDAWYDSKT